MPDIQQETAMDKRRPAADHRPVARDDPKKVRPTDPPFDAEVEHPVGTGVGAVAGGAAVGAALGSVAGPIGTAVGAAAATLAGAWAGREIARRVDVDEEDDYWRGHYNERPYVREGVAYDEYAPAYRYGIDAYARHGGHAFEHVEPDLAAGWDTARGDSRLAWTDARPAARDAWERVRETMVRVMPGKAGS
jgi:hypothetical protein